VSEFPVEPEVTTTLLRLVETLQELPTTPVPVLELVSVQVLPLELLVHPVLRDTTERLMTTRPVAVSGLCYYQLVI
jgi:hypothetical protein